MAQPNLFAPQTQWGASLSGLVDSLYSPDAAIKREASQAMTAQRKADADLKRMKIEEFAAKKAEKAAQTRMTAEAITNMVAGIGRSQQGGADIMAAFNNGGVLPSTPDTSDDVGSLASLQPGRVGGYEPPHYQEAMAKLVPFFGAQALGGKNIEQVAKAGSQYQTQGARSAIMDTAPTDPLRVAQAYFATSGRAPFDDTQGRSQNLVTGALNETGPQAVANVAATNAQATQRTAAAGASSALAGQRRAETLPQVMVPSPVDGAPAVPALGKDISRAAVKAVGAPAASGLSEDAVEDAAHRYTIDGTLPPNLGRGAQGEATKVRILNRASELAKASGNAGAAARIGQIAGRAGSGALLQLTKQEQAVGAFEKNALRNADIALQASAAADRTGIPVLNRWILAGQKNILGDPEVSRFHAATTTFVNEYAKIMSGSMGNTAVSDSLRRETEALLGTKDTPEQFKAVIDLMKQEMRNRMLGFEEQKAELTRSMSQNAPGVAPASPTAGAPRQPAPTNAKGWKLMQDAKGNKAYVGPKGEVEEVR